MAACLWPCGFHVQLRWLPLTWQAEARLVRHLTFSNPVLLPQGARLADITVKQLTGLQPSVTVCERARRITTFVTEAGVTGGCC